MNSICRVVFNGQQPSSQQMRCSMKRKMETYARRRLSERASRLEGGGRLVAAGSFKAGSGYRVALPVAAYFSWQGNNLEGRGVPPDIEERLSPEALWNDEDNQLTWARRSLEERATNLATA